MGPRVPPASPPPRERTARATDRRPGLTPAPGLPHPNWFHICNFRGSGTQLGRALGPWGTPQAISPASARPGGGEPGSGLGARGSGLGAPGSDSAASGAGAAFPAQAPRRCLRAPHRLAQVGQARGGVPRAFGRRAPARERPLQRARRAAQCGRALPGPGRDAQASREGETTHAAANVGTRRRRGLGALRGRGLRLARAFHIGTTSLRWRHPNLTCCGACRPPTPRAPRLPAGGAPQTPGTRGGGPPGRCSKGQKMETVRKESPNPAGPEAHRLT